MDKLFMHKSVLEIIDDFGEKVEVMEGVVETTYQTVRIFNERFTQAYEEGKRLSADLRDFLVQSKSFRKKDFDFHTNSIFHNIESQKKDLSWKQQALDRQLTEYLARQRTLTGALRKQVHKLVEEGEGEQELRVMLEKLKRDREEEREQMLASWQSLQHHLEALCQQQEELNDQIRRLLAKGMHLHIRELREIGASRCEG